MKQIISTLCGVGLLAFSLMAADEKKKGDASAAAGNAEKGKETFEQCSVCHNVDSDEKKMGPSLKGLFKKATLTNKAKVTEKSVRDVINAGGNGMPAYADMLTDEERNDLIAYLKTL